MDQHRIKNIVEAALLAAGHPLPMEQLENLFGPAEEPGRESLHQALTEIAQECEHRGIELKQVASGWRLQVKADLSPWVSRLWEERPTRYSRALMETLALIAYRQPITRGEIEEIRGVSVNTQTIKTLEEREWIRALGHRDVPGKPALYGTTRQFLDHFNLKSLDELPTLAELRDIDSINAELDLDDPFQAPDGDTDAIIANVPLAEARIHDDVDDTDDTDDADDRHDDIEATEQETVDADADEIGTQLT
jgi:segregation and condensation protein B